MFARHRHISYYMYGGRKEGLCAWCGFWEWRVWPTQGRVICTPQVGKTDIHAVTLQLVSGKKVKADDFGQCAKLVVPWSAVSVPKQLPHRRVHTYTTEDLAWLHNSGATTVLATFGLSSHEAWTGGHREWSQLILGCHKVWSQQTVRYAVQRLKCPLVSGPKCTKGGWWDE